MFVGFGCESSIRRHGRETMLTFALTRVHIGLQEDIDTAASEQYIRQFLAEHNLVQYASSLFDLGHDDLDYLQTKNPQYLSEIAQSVGMPVGHKDRFIDALQQVYIRARYV